MQFETMTWSLNSEPMRWKNTTDQVLYLGSS